MITDPQSVMFRGLNPVTFLFKNETIISYDFPL